jgi:hypothetical protein
MSAGFFIDNCESIDECQYIHGTQRYAGCATEAPVFVNNEEMVFLSRHDSSMRTRFMSSS